LELIPCKDIADVVEAADSSGNPGSPMFLFSFRRDWTVWRNVADPLGTCHSGGCTLGTISRDTAHNRVSLPSTILEWTTISSLPSALPVRVLMCWAASTSLTTYWVDNMALCGSLPEP